MKRIHIWIASRERSTFEASRKMWIYIDTAHWQDLRSFPQNKGRLLAGWGQKHLLTAGASFGVASALLERRVCPANMMWEEANTASPLWFQGPVMEWVEIILDSLPMRNANRTVFGPKPVNFLMRPIAESSSHKVVSTDLYRVRRRVYSWSINIDTWVLT